MIAVSVIAALTLLALGYAAGRLRPWERFGMWVEDLLLPHNHKHWLGNRMREWSLFAALTVTQPRAALDVWRTRKSPEAS
ncbi:hypothetical protein ABZ023_34870 [Streptomyces sp. NPDC006367]|uniref:hypothetical protein n=1 Tax=unclassified Streptomyces TaxID=2593676 RepID=UPI0033AAEB0D